MYVLQEELGGAGTIIGVDEVGRGPLAGPLAVAAVILPQEPHIWGLNDSKKLTPLQREHLDAQIRAHARAVGIAVSYTHLTLPTILRSCRSRWSPYH